MIKALHLADIHLGSGLSHGQVSLDMGLNSRWGDFVATLG